jgi:hypothetical protein
MTDGRACVSATAATLVRRITHFKGTSVLYNSTNKETCTFHPVTHMRALDGRIEIEGNRRMPARRSTFFDQLRAENPMIRPRRARQKIRCYPLAHLLLHSLHCSLLLPVRGQCCEFAFRWLRRLLYAFDFSQALLIHDRRNEHDSVQTAPEIFSNLQVWI